MPQPAVRHKASKSSGPVRTGKAGWDEAVRAFLGDGRRRNLSRATLENYEWHISGVRVKAFLADHRVGSPADFTAAHLGQFESELIDAGSSPGTVATFHRILKNFLGFCLRNGLGGDTQALAVKGPRLADREPEVFTPAEERRILSHLRDRPRDLMLVELMLRTGVRVEEAAGLTLDDLVDGPSGQLLRVRQGKGRKDRVVPLDTPKDALSRRLRTYVTRVRPAETEQRALFLSSRREGSQEWSPLTSRAIQTLFRRISDETGIHANPHKCRHTFATRALAAGVDVMALQKALGHTTLAMVSRYVHYQSDDLLRAWGKRRD